MRVPVGLHVAGLGFRYGSGPAVLDDLDARFEAGSMVALTGPSGSGKSTLLYLLGLMARPTSGEVWLAGERVDGLPDASRAALRAHRFGFVFQDAVLDPTRTILDNTLETVLYRGAQRAQESPRAMALLERFGVAERIRRRPGQISGGQAQRIALCRALLADPSILLADEPTGNLDQASGALVIDALQEHARTGATVVVATHDPVVMGRCDVVMSVVS